MQPPETHVPTVFITFWRTLTVMHQDKTTGIEESSIDYLV